MSYVNSGIKVQTGTSEDKAYHLTSPKQLYDFNFVYPVRDLKQSFYDPNYKDLVILEPFLPSRHAAEYHEKQNDAENSVLFTYLPSHYGPFATIEGSLTLVERFREDLSKVLYAIIDLSTGKRVLAGIMACFKVDANNLWFEIGPALVFKRFHGSHVARHAAGLLLQNAFISLGLRRVQWTCNPKNLASRKFAHRTGFKYEGCMRWTHCLPNSKVAGLELSNELTTVGGHTFGSPEAGLGRHSELWAISFEDWTSSRENLPPVWQLVRSVMGLGSDEDSLRSASHHVHQ